MWLTNTEIQCTHPFKHQLYFYVSITHVYDDSMCRMSGRHSQGSPHPKPNYLISIPFLIFTCSQSSEGEITMPLQVRIWFRNVRSCYPINQVGVSSKKKNYKWVKIFSYMCALMISLSHRYLILVFTFPLPLSVFKDHTSSIFEAFHTTFTCHIYRNRWIQISRRGRSKRYCFEQNILCKFSIPLFPDKVANIFAFNCVNC